jgi:hypothetical protein
LRFISSVFSPTVSRGNAVERGAEPVVLFLISEFYFLPIGVQGWEMEWRKRS